MVKITGGKHDEASETTLRRHSKQSPVIVPHLSQIESPKVPTSKSRKSVEVETPLRPSMEMHLHFLKEDAKSQIIDKLEDIKTRGLMNPEPKEALAENKAKEIYSIIKLVKDHSFVKAQEALWNLYDYYRDSPDYSPLSFPLPEVTFCLENIGKLLKFGLSNTATTTKSEVTVEKQVIIPDNTLQLRQTEREDEGALQRPYVRAPNVYDSLRTAERHASKECPALVPDIQKLLAKISGAEITGHAAAPKLSEADLAAFKAHAAKNQWDSEGDTAASEHIKTKFDQWLGRGLALTNIRAAQEELANAYYAEVRKDPSKRIDGLYVRPHKVPAGNARVVVAVRKVRHIADLSEEEKAERRAKDKARKQKQRSRLEQRHSAPQL